MLSVKIYTISKKDVTMRIENGGRKLANRIIWNAREHLVPEIQKRQFKKILVVTDETLMKCDVASKVIDALKDGNISFEVFDKVKPNPTIKNCHDGIEACKKTGADAIVAVGGGSVIDTAKCIGIVINNPEFYDINSLEGTADTKKLCQLLIRNL